MNNNQHNINNNIINKNYNKTILLTPNENINSNTIGIVN